MLKHAKSRIYMGSHATGVTPYDINAWLRNDLEDISIYDEDRKERSCIFACGTALYYVEGIPLIACCRRELSSGWFVQNKNRRVQFNEAKINCLYIRYGGSLSRANIDDGMIFAKAWITSSLTEMDCWETFGRDQCMERQMEGKVTH